MKDFVFCRIFLTRKCLLSCKYCGIVREKKKEMGLVEWKSIFKLLKDKVVSFTLMGGEPVLYSKFFKLMSWLNSEDINYTLSTTGVYRKEVLERVLRTEFYGVAVSIDNFENGIFFDRFSERKSKSGFFLLDNIGAKHKIACITLGKNNLSVVVDLVKEFSSRGWLTCINPCQFKKDKDRFFSDGERVFTEKDRESTIAVGQSLVQLKKQGYLLSGTEWIYQNWVDLVLNQNWKCINTPSIFVDSDGGLGCCWDYKGKRVQKWSVESLVVDLQKFRSSYLKDVIEGCSGCSWESQILADRILAGKELESLVL